MERGKRERCDRIFGGKRWDPYKEKKGKWKTETGIGQTQVAKG